MLVPFRLSHKILLPLLSKIQQGVRIKERFEKTSHGELPGGHHGLKKSLIANVIIVWQFELYTEITHGFRSILINLKKSFLSFI